MREEKRRNVRWRGETGAAGKARGQTQQGQETDPRKGAGARDNAARGGKQCRAQEGQCCAEEGEKPRGTRIKKAPNARSFFVFVFGLFRPVVST